MTRLVDLDYDLPRERIAQRPAARRDAARLLHLDRASGRIAHRVFRDLPGLLAPGDVLVLNDSRVVPARLALRKPTGGGVEALVLEPLGDGSWEALLSPSGRVREGMTLTLAGAPALLVERRAGAGRWVIRGAAGGDPGEILRSAGEVPLPPYIRRAGTAAERRHDRERYQTVYAASPGSVAAPTAGLHFTPAGLAALRARGIELVRTTLHVGPGTFRPVTAERLADHRMDPERFEVSAAALAALCAARHAGRRLVAAGTTAVRVLETLGAAGLEGTDPVSGETSLFITPGWRFEVVGAMLTNFHQPRSTPYALVTALAGPGPIRRAYAEALGGGYRFLSYGDAMLIT